MLMYTVGIAVGDMLRHIKAKTACIYCLDIMRKWTELESWDYILMLLQV